MTVKCRNDDYVKLFQKRSEANGGKLNRFICGTDIPEPEITNEVSNNLKVIFDAENGGFRGYLIEICGVGCPYMYIEITSLTILIKQGIGIMLSFFFKYLNLNQRFYIKHVLVRWLAKNVTSIYSILTTSYLSNFG